MLIDQLPKLHPTSNLRNDLAFFVFREPAQKFCNFCLASVCLITSSPLEGMTCTFHVLKFMASSFSLGWHPLLNLDLLCSVAKFLFWQSLMRIGQSSRLSLREVLKNVATVLDIAFIDTGFTSSLNDEHFLCYAYQHNPVYK